MYVCMYVCSSDVSRIVMIPGSARNRLRRAPARFCEAPTTSAAAAAKEEETPGGPKNLFIYVYMSIYIYI